MSHRTDEFEDFDQDDEIYSNEIDDPLEDDMDDDDSPNVVACPSCGEDVSEIAEKCPHCGDWIMPGRDEPNPWLSKGWIAAIIVALIIALVFLVTH